MDGLDAAVVKLAEGQHGVVSYRELVALGANAELVRRRVRDGHWCRSGYGVYRIGAAPATFEQAVMIAVLRAGPGALVSHRTAARLWGLSASPNPPIEISVPRHRRHTAPGVVVHRSGDLDLARARSIDGIPLTGVARTILDLGAVAPSSVRRAVWAGLRSQITSWPTLLDTLVSHARRGRAGVGPLREVLAEHYGERATDSTTEDLAFEILVDAGFEPLPEKQVQVVCADGVPVTVDFGWPAVGALLEVFGVDHFTNEDLVHIDLHRRNQIELTGHRLLVYSGRLLARQPDQFVRDVGALIDQCAHAPEASRHTSSRAS